MRATGGRIPGNRDPSSAPWRATTQLITAKLVNAKRQRAGHSGLLYPRGTAGRAQRAGVSDICTAGARCVMRP